MSSALARVPRVALGTFPTALDEAPRLSEHLGVRVLIKRDDLTGLAMGGNKVRKLEYLIAEAIARGADAVITTGGSQSNHARLTAAACRKMGLECHLVLDRGIHGEMQGNVLLDRLFGARVRWLETSDPEAAVTAMEGLADTLRSKGRNPFVIPRGGSVPTGASGYVGLVPELLTQLDGRGGPITHLYLGTGSTGTHSGVLAGSLAAGAPWIVQGISVSRARQEQEDKVRSLTAATLQHLNLTCGVPPHTISVDDAYRGPAYGIPTNETFRAIMLLARLEGLILDPVYTGKAMAGLIDHALAGRLKDAGNVIFLHTGGAPALFAYHQEVADALGSATK